MPVKPKNANQENILDRFREEDLNDPNKDNFIKETSMSQRAFLRNRLESMGGRKNCGTNDAFTQFDLVDELKRNSDFDNKSRMALWYLIKNQSRWIDQKEFSREFHPEQEEFIRKKIQLLDGNKRFRVGAKRTLEYWVDSNGNEISKKKVAKELFEEKNILGDKILGDKTLDTIYTKIMQRNKWI